MRKWAALIAPRNMVAPSKMHLYVFSNLNNPNPVQQQYKRVSGVELIPFLGKIYTVGAFVVIVLHQLAHQKNVNRYAVFAMVVVVVIAVAIFMAAPVYNGAMYRPHKKMHRQ